MTQPDVETLRRRLDALTRAAQHLRQHAPDLWTLAWEPANSGDSDRVHGGTADHTPRAGDPRARRLLEQLTHAAARAEAELVGYQRIMTALFYAGSESPEPSRGSLISHAEHDRLLANQRRRRNTDEYIPARFLNQPAHPGKRP